MRVAQLIGEAGRIRMLSALLGGEHSASDLAMVADISPQTASSHLSKLLAGGLVSCERDGRQRLYRLRNPDVAAAIEALGSLARTPPTRPVSEIRFARTCYDHLAGVLAVAIRNAFSDSGALEYRNGQFVLSNKGKRVVRQFDIDVDALHSLRRSFAHSCLDWTERQHHIGGALGAALLTRFFQNKWLVRVRETREVRVTHAGEAAIEQHLGIRIAPLRASVPG